MKLWDIIRTQLMVMGIGAAMMLGAALQAQEIDNTVWDDSQNTVAYTQTAPAEQAPAQPFSSTTANDSASGAISLASLGTTPNVSEQSSLGQWTPSEKWITTSLIICIGLVALYALAEAKRANRNLGSRESHGSRTAILS